MNRTPIEWCDFSWNPVTGCLGPGGTPDKPNRCPCCYAHRLANGRLKPLYLSNPNVAPGCDPDDPFSPRFWRERLEEPLKRKKPAKIFVVDMGDLFGDYVPRDWIHHICSVALEAPQHTFQYLTKNPVRYKLDWLSDNHKGNEWLGITVTNQKDWDERWPILAQVECAVKFVSFEPLLGGVQMEDASPLPDWIVLGAQTGLRPRIPDSHWVQELLWEARQAGIPAFVKDNLCEARTGYYIPRPREWPKEER